MRKSIPFLMVILAIGIVVVLLFGGTGNQNVLQLEEIASPQLPDQVARTPTLDFRRTMCRPVLRIDDASWGAMSAFKPPDNQETRGTTYSLCVEANFLPKKGECLVLSFGMEASNDYEKFEEFMRTQFHCDIHSFDAYTVTENMQRQLSMLSSQEISFEYKPAWIVNRFGIGPEQMKIIKPGTLQPLVKVLHHLQLHSRTIDVLKLHIRGEEIHFYLQPAYIKYYCRYVKQLIIDATNREKETSDRAKRSINYNHALNKLSQCFRIYSRDFPPDLMSLLQSDNSFLNPEDMVKYTLTFGRMYLVNANFL